MLKEAKRTMVLALDIPNLVLSSIVLGGISAYATVTFVMNKRKKG
jgi:hypothetical protein